MPKNENADGDFEMRLRFAEQAIRFWKKSRKNEGGRSPFVGQASTDVPLEDERPEQPKRQGS
jgi:hypothetical protein